MAIVDDIDSGEKIVLPKLRRLIFGESGAVPDSSIDVLECLSLPGLETLSISLSNRNRTNDRMISFLERSSPPLRELVLGNHLDFVSLSVCLRLMPDLRRFEVWYYPTVPGTTEQLFAALAEFPSLLPRLSTLVIRLGQKRDISESFWTVLSRALASRCIQLMAFHLMVPSRLPVSEIPAQVIATFGEVVMGGTEVRISATQERWNLVFY
jgi:hypothetical protein